MPCSVCNDGAYIIYFLVKVDKNVRKRRFVWARAAMRGMVHRIQVQTIVRVAGRFISICLNPLGQQPARFAAGDSVRPRVADVVRGRRIVRRFANNVRQLRARSFRCGPHIKGRSEVLKIRPPGFPRYTHTQFLREAGRRQRALVVLIAQGDCCEALYV